MIYGVKGVAEKFPEHAQKGCAEISRFTYKAKDNPLYELRMMSRDSFFRVHDGDYVRLIVNGDLMMSDTGMERYTNKLFINKAKGRILIAGLGIGMLLENILDIPEVVEVVVIEKYQDVIDLVAPAFTSPKLKIICADIFDYKMPKEEKFDCIYFDIWPYISCDNLVEMRKLHRKYAVNKASSDSFMDSWMKDYLKKLNK